MYVCMFADICTLEWIRRRATQPASFSVWVGKSVGFPLLGLLLTIRALPTYFVRAERCTFHLIWNMRAVAVHREFSRSSIMASSWRLIRALVCLPNVPCALRHALLSKSVALNKGCKHPTDPSAHNGGYKY